MPGVCGSCNELGAKLICGGCKSIYYCNQQCQVEAWKKGHKLQCKLLRKQHKVNVSISETMRSDDEKEKEIVLPPLKGKTARMIRFERVRGKGYGVIANCDIKRGTVIVRESPLLVIPPNPTPDIIWQEFCALSDSDKRIFMSLSMTISEVAAMYIDPFTGKLPKRLEPFYICRNNSVLMDPHGPTTTAIFPIISRVNHSCDSNVHWHWNKQYKEERLVAIQDIRFGTELCANYIGDNYYQRQIQLKKVWNIECQCNWCQTDEKEAFFKQYKKLEDDMQEMRLKTSEAYCETAKKLIKMTKDHLNGNPSTLLRHYFNAGQYASPMKRWSEAADYFESAMKEMRIAHGNDAVLSGVWLKEVMKLPKEHRKRLTKYKKPGIM